MYKPYSYAIALLCVLTFIACTKTPVNTTPPSNPTTTTGGNTGGGTINPSPVDTSTPLDPDPIKNAIGNYLGSLHVYKYVRTMGGKMLDSADITYDSQMKITNPESNHLLWEADGSLFFAMDFNGYSTNFADDEENRKYVVFHAKERYVDYFDRTIIKDKDKGTITTSGTEGTWYKQSN